MKISKTKQGNSEKAESCRYIEFGVILRGGVSMFDDIWFVLANFGDISRLVVYRSSRIIDVVKISKNKQQGNSDKMKAVGITTSLALYRGPVNQCLTIFGLSVSISVSVQPATGKVESQYQIG